MTNTEQDDDSNNEWSVMALSYQDVLLPRLQPLYDTMAHCVATNVLSKNETHKYRILDYGTGAYDVDSSIDSN